MAYEDTNLWLVVLLLLVATCIHQRCVHGEPQVPCIFIFGDSFSDSGNNNNLPTKAKASYKPYGIDFSSGPTGRFMNGRTSVDYITEFLGFDMFIPPSANTNGSDILKVVNYASGAAGIRPKSGKHMALRDLGARKFVLVGIGLSCTPYAISIRGTNWSSCVEEQNRAAFIFNDKLKALEDRCNKQDPGSKFIFVNSTSGASANLQRFGFTVLDKPCCPVGSNEGLRVPDQMPCQNRNQDVFYDGLHTATVVNALTAMALYNGSNPAFTYPMDINQLVHS